MNNSFSLDTFSFICPLSKAKHCDSGTEKLMNSNGRDLRRALFALKQVFQDDKDLVHAFVENRGLDVLVKIGQNSDHNYQNYILRGM